MSEFVKLLTDIIKDLGFPIVVSLWLMWFVSRVMVLNEIVQALIRIDERIERVLILMTQGDEES